MRIVDIDEEKTDLSQLVDQAAKGEPCVIAKAGKPLVKRVAVDVPAQPRRLGFMEGQFKIPDDFDRMGEREIEALFYGTEPEDSETTLPKK
jgi:antitoxin (DNA-binding transcriptional repressor) of toxin-antitoxin stability system